MAEKKEKKVTKKEVKKEDAKPKAVKEEKKVVKKAEVKETKAKPKVEKKVESKEKPTQIEVKATGSKVDTIKEKKDLAPTKAPKKEIKAEEKKVEQKVELKVEKKGEHKESQTKPTPKGSGKASTPTVAPKETPTKSSKKGSKKKKVKKECLLVKAKRKTAVATAKIESGNGRITINKKPIDLIDNKHLLLLVFEPVKLANNYKAGLVNGVNISVTVRGGGFMSQTIAARGCIAKGLVDYYKDDKLRDVYMKYDKALLVDDARRKEAKKQLGLGARAKKQHSKR
jgi:small subunit ribosomal protein S9